MIGHDGICEIADQAICFAVIGKHFAVKAGNAPKRAEPEIIEMILCYSDYLRLYQTLLNIIILKVDFLCGNDYRKENTKKNPFYGMNKTTFM
jgi:hypothetical protein